MFSISINHITNNVKIKLRQNYRGLNVTQKNPPTHKCQNNIIKGLFRWEPGGEEGYKKRDGMIFVPPLYLYM